MLDDIHGLGEPTLCDHIFFYLTVSACDIHHSDHIILSKYKNPAEVAKGLKYQSGNTVVFNTVSMAVLKTTVGFSSLLQAAENEN